MNRIIGAGEYPKHEILNRVNYVWICYYENK
jgi:hypothetical protein